MNKINVLMISNDLNINGISSVILNYCRKINLNKFNVSIIAGDPVSKIYESECKAIGINIIKLSNRKKNTLRYYVSLWKMMKNNYDIAHIHGNSATISIELFIAHLRKVNIRIAHSHSVKTGCALRHKLLLPVFNRVCTHRFACSREAGEWLFGDEDFYIINNAFNTSKFKFNSSVRKEVRNHLNIKNKYVIGHVGRFNEQKNHYYLLKVFEIIAEEIPEAILFLIGDGPDYEKISELINSSNYKDRIILYGESEQTDKLYNAMDIFLFPSKSEGLGIAIIEAQINGLPCISSKYVNKETAITNNVTYLPIKDSDIEIWKENIIKYKSVSINRESVYKDNKKMIDKYNISNNVTYLENLYEQFYVEN